MTRNSILMLCALGLMTTSCLLKPKAGSSDSSTSLTSGDGNVAGNVGNTVTQLTTQGDYRILFVTHTAVNGSGGTGTTLGNGLADLDALCTTEASARGFSHAVFKAMVGANSRKPEDADWVLRDGKEYRRDDLTTVIGTAATDVSTLRTLITWTTPPSATQQYVWTGLLTTGAVDAFNCTDWTANGFDNTSSTLGTYGKSSILTEFVNMGYTSYTGDPLYYNGDADPTKIHCDQTHPVYCVETRQLPPPGTAKKLFLSTQTSLPSAGLSGFDNICAADATTLGLTGTYKAMVGKAGARTPCTSGLCNGASGTEQGINWVLHPNTIYTRADGFTYIGTTNAHAFFEGSLEQPIQDTSGTFWSGIGNGWVAGLACLGWTNNASSGSTSVGLADSREAVYLVSSISGNAYCDAHQKLLCAEQ